MRVGVCVCVCVCVIRKLNTGNNYTLSYNTGNFISLSWTSSSSGLEWCIPTQSTLRTQTHPHTHACTHTHTYTVHLHPSPHIHRYLHPSPLTHTPPPIPTHTYTPTHPHSHIHFHPSPLTHTPSLIHTYVCLLSLGSEHLSAGRVLLQKDANGVLLQTHVSDGLCCLVRFLTRVDKDEHLVPACMLHHLVIDNLIHQLCCVCV